jgi:hypothetical protein
MHKPLVLERVVQESLAISIHTYLLMLLTSVPSPLASQALLRRASRNDRIQGPIGGHPFPGCS